MTAANPILRLEGVSKHFGGLRVIEDLSFAVRRGSEVGREHEAVRADRREASQSAPGAGGAPASGEG